MKRVAVEELRLAFNTRLLEFVLTGQLDAVIRRNNHLAISRREVTDPNLRNPYAT
ncbi:MAG: hypothetical protein HY691_20645 [Chloroflexi bacterium]|nr:hypothetical protein [Chloroflexota bacterium]